MRSGTLRMKPLRERIGNLLKHHKKKADLRVRYDGITAMLGSAHAYLFKRRPRRASGSLRGTHPKLVRRRRPTCAGLQARCSRYRGSIEISCCAYIDWPIRCGLGYWDADESIQFSHCLHVLEHSAFPGNALRNMNLGSVGVQDELGV